LSDVRIAISRVSKPGDMGWKEEGVHEKYLGLANQLEKAVA
jgi:hypothetical protein